MLQHAALPCYFQFLTVIKDMPSRGLFTDSTLNPGVGGHHLNCFRNHMEQKKLKSKYLAKNYTKQHNYKYPNKPNIYSTFSTVFNTIRTLVLWSPYRYVSPRREFCLFRVTLKVCWTNLAKSEFLH